MNNWHRFWEARDGKKVDRGPFYQNFKVMHKMVKQRYGTKDGLKSLEVGCGRGIMSDFLHAFGWDTYCVDNYYTALEDNHDHKFYKADAFDLPFPDAHFDLVFSYGLLEHFIQGDQMILLQHMLSKTKPKGISIHYVVPKKMANWREDKSVYRDHCYWLRERPIQWVYPALKGLAENIAERRIWETNKWWGKGFWFEDFGFSYR